MIRPQIRPMHPTDREAFRALLAACGDITDPQDDPRNHERMLLAWHGGRVVGSVLWWQDHFPLVWIGELLVHPDLRGSGVGVFLWRAVIRHCRDMGVTRVRYCIEDRSLALQLCRDGHRIVDPAMLMEYRFRKE